MRVPWTASISNHSILKEINAEYSLEGLMLKLKLQYFGHLLRSTDSLEESQMLGMTEGRTAENEMVGWHHDLMDVNLKTEEPGMLHLMDQQVGLSNYF